MGFQYGKFQFECGNYSLGSKLPISHFYTNNDISVSDCNQGAPHNLVGICLKVHDGSIVKSR